MELKYVKKLSEAGITENELSAKAKTGIKGIKDTMRGIALQEGKGRAASSTALEKLSFNDEIVCDEIDKVIAIKSESKKAADAAAATAEAEKVKAENAAKAKAEAEAKEAKDKEEKEKGAAATATTGDSKPDPKGLLVEAELKKLLDGGKEKLTLTELKSAAPAAYSAVFNAYKSGEANGVETSHYSLIETAEKEIFTLSKI